MREEVEEGEEGRRERRRRRGNYAVSPCAPSSSAVQCASWCAPQHHRAVRCGAARCGAFRSFRFVWGFAFNDGNFEAFGDGIEEKEEGGGWENDDDVKQCGHFVFLKKNNETTRSELSHYLFVCYLEEEEEEK